MLRLRVVRPRQHELLAVGLPQLLLQGHHQRQLLTWVGDGLHVDDGDGGELREGGDDLVLAVDRPVLELREGADGDAVDVARQHPSDLAHVLFGLLVHDHAVVELDGPGALAGLEDDGLHAEVVGAELEAGARAQRRVEEDQGDRLAGQRRVRRLRLLLQVARLVEDRLQGVARVIESREEVPHGAANKQRWRCASTSSPQMTEAHRLSGRRRWL